MSRKPWQDMEASNRRLEVLKDDLRHWLGVMIDRLEMYDLSETEQTEIELARKAKARAA